MTDTRDYPYSTFIRIRWKMMYAARRRNETYPREKYTFEIDTRPEMIVLDRATNTREASMWRHST